MDPLLFAWGVALIVTVGALPVGLIRLVAIRGGGAVPDRALTISTYFAIALGVVGLVVLAALSLALLA